MSPLRKRMIEELQLRNLSPATAKVVSFRLACVRGRADLFLRGIGCQDAAYRGAPDLEMTGDLGFADASTMQFSDLGGIVPRLPAAPVSFRSGGHGPSRRGPVPAESPFRTPRIRPVMRPWPGRRVWSDPGLRSGRRNRPRDAPVPGGSPTGLLPIGPSGPAAIPAPHRFRGVAPHRATPPVVGVRMRRYRLPSPAGLSSNRAGRRIPAERGSATGWSVGRWWKRGRRGRHGTFSPVCVPGRKPFAILLYQSPVFGPFSRDALA